MHLRRSLLVVGAIVGLSAGCAAPFSDVSPPPSPTPLPAGGTLRIGAIDRSEMEWRPFDVNAIGFGGGLFRCCLLRTPLAYNGRATNDGGTVLHPDLATALPTISADGLTWTVTLRKEIRYAPPFDHVTVRSQDIIRGVERALRFEEAILPGAETIVGMDAFVSGEAETITGLEAPQDETLVIRLSEPNGGLGQAMTLPAFAPLPPGADTGHEEDYHLFVVSTGPYMYEGSPLVDPSLPASEQRPVNAGLPPRTITLVRNPSWDEATDPLRGAHVDRIEVAPVGPYEAGLAALEAGRIDLLDVPAHPSDVVRYQSDPSLRAQLTMADIEAMATLPMNLAVPPFDDVAVRRAVNFAIDKAAVAEAIVSIRNSRLGRTLNQIPAPMHHSFPNSVTKGLLSGYAPFRTAADHGDGSAARREMMASRYDTDGDGECDAAACDAIVAVYHPEFRPPAEIVARNLEEIGIHLALHEVGEGFDMSVPSDRVALAVNWFMWGAIVPDATDYAVLLAGGASIDGENTINQPLLGALPEQLAEWGYEVTAVPSADRSIAACRALTGHLRFTCWASLDKRLTEHIVPWVPLFSARTGWIASTRVLSVHIDQGSGAGFFPSLDQLALAPGSGP